MVVQDVDAAVPLGNVRDQRGDRGIVRYVQLGRFRLTARVDDLLDRPVRRRRGRGP